LAFVVPRPKVQGLRPLAFVVPRPKVQGLRPC
jgi:hypothetical protein